MPEPRILLSRSFSAALSPTPEAPRPMRVLSVHQRALNLMDDAGDILAVVTPEVGDGPFHIVLARPISFEFTRPGEPGRWQDEVLTLGDVRIDWRHARPWQPHLTPILITNDALQALRTCAQRSVGFQNRWSGMDDLTISRMQRGAAWIAQGMVEENAGAWRQGVSLLAGLGPGLTPAGDDYLLGALARLQLDSSFTRIPEIDALIRAGAQNTTRLSRAWLQHAVRGRFAAHWHALGNALLAGGENAICRAAEDILRVGATSGPQALAGFLLT